MTLHRRASLTIVVVMFVALWVIPVSTVHAEAPIKATRTDSLEEILGNVEGKNEANVLLRGAIAYPTPNRNERTCPAYKGKTSRGYTFPKDQRLSNGEKASLGIKISHKKKVVRIPVGLWSPPDGCVQIPKPNGSFLGVKSPAKYVAAIFAPLLENGLIPLINKRQDPLNQEDYIGAWRITEAWPPTRLHAERGHDLGYTIDLKLEKPDVGANDQRRRNMWRLIAELYKDGDICSAIDEYRVGAKNGHFHITAGFCRGEGLKPGDAVEDAPDGEPAATPEETLPDARKTTCNDGIRQDYEPCDPSTKPSQWVGLGLCKRIDAKYSGGTMQCNSDCTFNDQLCRQ